MLIRKKMTVFVISLLVMFFLYVLYGLNTYTTIFEGPDPMDHLDNIKDPVERESALKQYWGRELTHAVFKEMFGVDIQDGGIAQYSLQEGSADGDKDAVATAYYIGYQTAGLLSDMREKLVENYVKYYSKDLPRIDPEKEDEYFDSLLLEFGPSFTGRYNGIYLIEKNGEIFSDFNGIHLPVDISPLYLEKILLSIKPEILNVTEGS